MEKVFLQFGKDDFHSKPDERLESQRRNVFGLLLIVSTSGYNIGKQNRIKPSLICYAKGQTVSCSFENNAKQKGRCRLVFHQDLRYVNSLIHSTL